MIPAVLDGSAFRPFFQPVVNLETGAVVGFQALTRFDDGVPPDARFAAANRAGLALELEAATLRAALDAAARCLPRDSYLSLNASPALICSGSMQALLADVGRPIVLEITEHVAIDDYATLRVELADLGPAVRLAVDDAGAGYASFRHILELAPDLVKLDIGLIRGIDGDPARQALIAGIAYFATKRSVRLIAEGIETVRRTTDAAISRSPVWPRLLARPPAGQSRSNDLADEGQAQAAAAPPHDERIA